MIRELGFHLIIVPVLVVAVVILSIAALIVY